jgi:hypothetical protein
MQKVILGAIGLLALSVSGWVIPINYEKVSETVTVDPSTGHPERVTTWKYADGVTTTTTDDLTITNNETRRTPPLREFSFGEEEF